MLISGVCRKVSDLCALLQKRYITINKLAILGNCDVFNTFLVGRSILLLILQEEHGKTS